MSQNTQSQRNDAKGFAYALGGTLLVSTNFVTAKYGTKGFDPETFSLVWTTAAASYALVIVMVWGRGKELALPREARFGVVAMGVVTGIVMLSAWAGLALLDPSYASFLWRFAPVLTILLGGLVLHEKLRAVELCALGVMVAGGVLSTIGRWQVVGLGTVLALISCGATAVQLLLGKMKASQVHPMVLTFYRAAIGATVIAAWTFCSGGPNFHVPLRYWIVTLIGAFLGPCASYILTFSSYRYWDLSQESVVRTMQPLLVLPMAYLAFRQFPVAQELVGGSLILVGSLWIAWIHFIGERSR